MVFESIRKMQDEKLIPADLAESKAIANYTKAIGDGLLKVFSKMGISTLRSYHGAQIFEILGLSSTVVDRCFKGTISRIEGLDFDGIAGEALMNHYRAFPKQGRNLEQKLPVGGLYQWKRQGEYHSYNPDTITLLQQATRTNNYDLYKQYAHLVNDQTERHHTLRGLLSFNKRKPILVEEVEPVEKIMKRFATGAMSFGSISYEAHTTIAIAMNRMGARSNSGEGGEDERRFEKNPDGSWERSAIKQVASGRFGVTSYYLTNADELQIKIAQGAKPGEGGQLPGNKVDERIGRVRHSTPGVGLISPPPHHDIYSIEDLAQLIFDLKNANRQARISVKLVAEAGVGTIASGVAKAHADVILISGGDGGTGASPISSIRHTGLPWELGLAEAHQTLVANNLRSRVTLQADGQIKTGKDIAVAALLGAEEWGMATSALVVLGCLMMRQCHNNTCPTGIATQNADLRKLFKGKPEYLTNYFTFLAQDLREIMAGMGFRTVNEMIGQSDFLKMRDDIKFWKAKSLDLSPVLYKYPALPEIGLYKQIDQEHGIEKVLDLKLLEIARPAFDDGKKVYHELSIVNVDRTTGALLSNEISKKYKNKGLPPGTIHFKFRGSAGQSFGAFNARGLKLELEGEANDYFGKGLSGGELIVYPDKKATFRPHDNVIIGNVALYGATSGEAYIRGIAGQRFCVRNSGAKTVVEGVGNHGCEYMTGGIAVILGSTGKNFAAGMSGGIAYVYDPDHKLEMNYNKELVNLEVIDAEDQKILKCLVGKHHKYTGSLIAGHILSHFETETNNFVKVISPEYKAAIKHIPLAEHMGIEEVDGD